MMYNNNYNIAHKISNFISMKFRGKQLEVANLINYLNIEYKNNNKIKILDIGCDEGRLTNLLKNKIGKNVDLLGIDINKDAIKKAKNNFPNIDFQISDDLFIKNHKKYFDIIYSSHVLEHIDKMENFIDDKIQLLKNNGVIIIIIPQERIRGDLQLIHILFNFMKGVFKNPHIHKLEKEDVEKIMLKKGFKINNHIFTNLFYPYTSDKKRFDSIGVNLYFNKK